MTPVPVIYEPEVHGVQAVLPVEAAKVPDGQLEHVTVAVTPVKVPTAQAEQVFPAVGLDLPAGQALQTLPETS